jgi:hypothetical protein
MLQVEGLDELIADGMTLSSKHVLREVFLHLEYRGIRFNEILNAIVDLIGERGYKQASLQMEDIITHISSKAYSIEEKGDDLNDII